MYTLVVETVVPLVLRTRGITMLPPLVLKPYNTQHVKNNKLNNKLNKA